MKGSLPRQRWGTNRKFDFGAKKKKSFKSSAEANVRYQRAFSKSSDILQIMFMVSLAQRVIGPSNSCPHELWEISSIQIHERDLSVKDEANFQEIQQRN